jgi:hypothetical protein
MLLGSFFGFQPLTHGAAALIGVFQNMILRA